MGCIKVFTQRRSSDHNRWTFSSKQTKNLKNHIKTVLTWHVSYQSTFSFITIPLKEFMASINSDWPILTLNLLNFLMDLPTFHYWNCPSWNLGYQDENLVFVIQQVESGEKARMCRLAWHNTGGKAYKDKDKQI